MGATDIDRARAAGDAAMAYRESVARRNRREDDGEDVPSCDSCGTELDAGPPAHSSRCPDAHDDELEIADPEVAEEPSLEELAAIEGIPFGHDLDTEKSGDAAASPEMTGHGVARWTKESAIRAVQEWAEANGRPPRQQDTTGDDSIPNPSTVRTLEPGLRWSDLVEQAGFERPRRGGSGRGPMSAEERAKIREGMARAREEPPAVEEAKARWHITVKGTGLRYESALDAYAAADEIEAQGEQVAEDARFDGDTAKAEKALDESRELAGAIRISARVAEQRESERATKPRRPPVVEGSPENGGPPASDYVELLVAFAEAQQAHEAAAARLSELSSKLKAHPLFQRAQDQGWL